MIDALANWIIPKSANEIYKKIEQFKDVPTLAPPEYGEEVDIFDDPDNEQQFKKAKEKGLLDEEIADRRSARQMREDYALWVYRYLVGFSIFVGIIVLMDGWNLFWFDLEPSIMEYLVGSTAVAAIGLVLAVTHGLFGRNINSK